MGNDDEGQRRDTKHEGPSRGPEGTEFLDLEISQVLFSEAAGLAREAARDLLRETLKARLRERLGDRLAEIARVAADSLADDIEANLEIERLISAQREKKRATGERVRAAVSGNASPRAGASPSPRSRRASKR